MCTRVITLVAIALCLALNAFAQKNLDKPFDTWSKDDALKVLSDSPWAKKIDHTQPTSSLSSAPSSGATRPNTPAEQRVPEAAQPSIVIQLHSARPIREAIVRLQQIASGYDKKSDADKAAFDVAQKPFLECPICADYYVITIAKSRSRQVLFSGMTADDIKRLVKLVNDKGDERQIERFDAAQNPGDVAVLYFKRSDDKGSPFVTEDSKEVRLVFTKEFLNSKNPSAEMIPANTTFKISKMVVGGKLLF